MLVRKSRISKYTLRIPSPRVTPSNSLSGIEWDNETKYNRKTTLRWSSKKIKCNICVAACGLTIAIIIVIAILVPLTSTSKSSTAKNIGTTLSVTNTSLASPNLVTTTLSTAGSTTTSTTLNITTTTQSTSTSTVSETATTSTTTETTTITQSTSTSTTSETTTITQSTSISPTSGTTNTTQSTSTTTTSETITITQGTSISTTSETTTITQSTSTSTTSETTSTTQSTSTTTTSTTITQSTSTTVTSTTTTSTTTTESTSTTTTSTSTTQSTSTTTTSTSTTSTVTISLRWNQTGTSVLGAAGNAGIASNHLYFPLGIVFNSFDTLYVADGNNDRVQMLLMGNTAATTVAGSSSGIAGSNASLLNYTNDVGVDSNSNVYVVDSYNNRIQLWTVNATSGITIAGGGIAGNSTNQLNWPRAIAFDLNTNTYYISDASNNRVMSYTLNSTVGTLVAGGNGAGNTSTQLNNPRGLYFDSTTNSLIIANAGANNVVRWAIGASNWTLVAGNINGTSGSGSDTLYGPWDVTLDSMGNVYVCDRYNDRIQFFLAGQTNGTTIAGVSGTSGSSSTKLSGPLSVALDSQLNLYVSDSSNDRIQEFVRY